MSSLSRWLTAACVAIPCAAAPLRVEARGEPEPVEAPAPDEPPAEQAPSDDPASATDTIHDSMVKAFAGHFQQGRVHYLRGAYALAAIEFEQAFAAFPAEAALKNVALSHERAGDDVAAAIAARRYLALPACAPDDVDKALCGSHRDELVELLDRVMPRVVELRLDVAAGVQLREVRINGRVTPRDDFPVLVAPGRVDVELEGAATGQRRQRVIEVRAGETQTIVVESFDAPAVPRDREPPTNGTPRARGKWLRPTFWTGVGLTSVSLVAVATLGGLAVSAGKAYRREIDEFNANPAPPPPEPGEPALDLYPHEEEDRYEQMQRTTNVMIGVSAGLAMLTLVVGAVAFTRPRNSGTSRASTRAQWLFDGSGLVVRY